LLIFIKYSVMYYSGMQLMWKYRFITNPLEKLSDHSWTLLSQRNIWYCIITVDITMHVLYVLSKDLQKSESGYTIFLHVLVSNHESVNIIIMVSGVSSWFFFCLNLFSSPWLKDQQRILLKPSSKASSLQNLLT
jgi:hypothetical protein